jgi:phage tail tape-measure protein
MSTNEETEKPKVRKHPSAEEHGTSQMVKSQGLGGAVGTAVGTVTGAAAGAAVGGFGGPAGMAVGAIVGAGIGALGGKAAGDPLTPVIEQEAKQDSSKIEGEGARGPEDAAG